MTVLPDPPVFTGTPMAQITPFTYREGATLMYLVERLRSWSVKFGPEVQNILDEALDELTGYVDDAKNFWQNKFDDFMANVVEELEALNDQAAANLVNNEVSKLRIALDGVLDMFNTATVQPALDALQDSVNDDFNDFTSSINTQFTNLSTSLNTTVDGLGTRVGSVESTLAGRLSPSNAATYYVEPRKLGAVGNGVADDTVPLQTALDLAKILSPFAGMNRVVIMLQPGAKYRVTQELVISRRTTLYGHGAEIVREHSGYLLMNGVRGESYPGYSGHGDITIRDVVLNAKGTQFPGVGSTLVLAHSENVLLDNVTIVDSTSHGIELNSQRNARINNCKFYGYLNANANDYVEAIQLDIAVSGGFGAFGAHDATPCENVRITDCIFDRSPLLDSFPRAIGSHGSRVDRPHNDVAIRGCTFRGHKSVALRPYNWNHVSVDDCHALSPGGFMQANTPITGSGETDNTKTADGVQTGASVSISDIRITSCSSTNGVGVWLAGQASGRIREVAIIGCSFTDSTGVGAVRGITGAYIDGVVVDSCAISGFEIGIGFLANALEYRARFTNNDIRYCYAHGIYASQFRQLTIVGNQTYNCGYNSDVGSHIRVSGGSDRFAAASNAGYINGDYPSNYGLYFGQDSVSGSVVGNVYSGVGTVNTVVIPDKATISNIGNIS